MTIEYPGTPSGSNHRFVNGIDIVVHGRTAGLHQVLDPKHCSIAVHGDDKDIKQLPLLVNPTGQSSASPLFRSAGPFRVSMVNNHPESGIDKCNATVFDEKTGEPLSYRRATTASPLVVREKGAYFVVTEAYDCRLIIEEESE